MDTHTATKVANDKLTYLKSLHHNAEVLSSAMQAFIHHTELEPAVTDQDGKQATFVDVHPVKIAGAFDELLKSYTDKLASMIRTAEKNPNYRCTFHKSELVRPVFDLLATITGEHLNEISNLGEISEFESEKADEISSLRFEIEKSVTEAVNTVIDEQFKPFDGDKNQLKRAIESAIEKSIEETYV